jgi:hypothetical protein
LFAFGPVGFANLLAVGRNQRGRQIDAPLFNLKVQVLARFEVEAEGARFACREFSCNGLVQSEQGGGLRFCRRLPFLGRRYTPRRCPDHQAAQGNQYW